jgi:hypothetical protein
MRAILTFVATVLFATAAAGEPNEVGFPDLSDPAAMNFDDPFRAMGTENLMRLRTVVRLRERLATEVLSPEVRSRLAARVAQARAVLEADGYDVEALVDQRWDIARKRRAARLAINPALVGDEVAMSGYLIPAPALEDGTPIGYLVSAVGLCSHLPTPPPNQLVRVRLGVAELPDITLYTPVRLAGTLRADASDQTVFVLDGHVRMVSMWTLDAQEASIETVRDASLSMPDWRDPLFTPAAQAVGNRFR